jgi:hypothetical protein
VIASDNWQIFIRNVLKPYVVFLQFVVLRGSTHVVQLDSSVEHQLSAVFKLCKFIFERHSVFEFYSLLQHEFNSALIQLILLLFEF